MEMVINLVGNLGAFVPIGFLWPIVRNGRTNAWRVTLLSGVVSLLIEMFQFATGQRIADIDDVILNTLSGLLGYLLYRLVNGLLRGRLVAAKG
jgi:glycopeptide antibiotics resistance protein